MAKPKSKSKAGRPQGSSNKPVEHAAGELTRCPGCQSTKRGPYTTKNVQTYVGEAPDGKPFTRILRRRTVCLDCGQHRIDRHYEYHRSDV